MATLRQVLKTGDFRDVIFRRWLNNNFKHAESEILDNKDLTREHLVNYLKEVSCEYDRMDGIADALYSEFLHQRWCEKNKGR